MSFFSQYSLFALKALTFALTFLLAFAGILALSRKSKPKLEITSLNTMYEETQIQMFQEIKNKKQKKRKKTKKNEKPSLYVLDFCGDIKASQVNGFRDAITAILSIVEKKDEVVLRLESPGGAVNAYGLATSQLQRIRNQNIPLTVCIDKIAASGGYLMACVANQIIAAPFAIIGSIGVVAQLPNFHRWLKKHNIDIELLTAGEYKRTLTLLAENTETGRKKFKEDLEKIHLAFKEYVLSNRPQLDIEEVSKGEHWLAKDAFDLKLVDSLKTSDEHLVDQMDDFNVYSVAIHTNKSFVEKLLKPAMQWLHPWG